MTRGNRIRARQAWEWEAQSIMASENAADCLLLGDTERAAEWTRLAVTASEVARLKRLEEKSEKHSPEG
jgi:hypothetical protein